MAANNKPRTYIMVDPGHGIHSQARHGNKGKQDPGAVGYGKYEENYASLIGDKVCNLLRKWGFIAHSTRSNGSWGLKPQDYNPVAPGTKDALKWRRDLAKMMRATHFISIHWNGFTLPSAYGTCTIVRPDASAESIALAKSIQGNLLNSLYHFDAVRDVPNWKVKDRGIPRMRLGVLRQDIPCCLVEPEFITNTTVNKLMEDSSFLWTVGFGIASGIKKFITKEELQ